MPRSEEIPLSFAQQRLWFLAQMEGGREAYHIPFGVRLKGELDRQALRQALDRIVARHEALRTRFVIVEGEPRQRITPAEHSRFQLLEQELRQHGEQERAGELNTLIQQEGEGRFDLEKGPLIRGRLIRLAEDEHVLLVTMHHIVSDGWSMGVLAGELNALYGAFLGGKADPLPELEIQYADYAVWQRQWMEGEILQQQAAYWKSTLAGAPALLELPTDHRRPIRQDFAGGFVELVLDEQLTAGLKDLSRRQSTTLYMTLLAGWAILLARLSGQQDVVIGSPVANRGRTEIENLIGFFVNTLALRLDLSGSPSVSQLLEQTKAQSLAAQRHQDIPFEQVVELAQPVRSLAHSPLFQVMFAWQNAEARPELPGLEVLLLQPPHKAAQFDLTLFLQLAGDTISGAIEYASALFEAATVHRYIGYFLALLKAMVADDAQTIDRLPMLSEEEREQVLYGWNETKAEFSSEKCVHELFEEQVRRSPQATAVVFEEEELSYGELNARANRLAHYLRELGVKPDERVAICVERGFEMIVGLLAILKAGGAYVPLDPAYPEERLQYMLEDSAPAALLMQGHLARLVPGISEAFPTLDLNDASGWSGKPDVNPKRADIGITPENLAYIIYTSGSTGRPKGVMVPHRAINRLVLNNRYAKFEASDRVAFASNPAFDATTMEVWAPLLNGGSIAVIDQSVLLNAAKFGETLKRQAVNILWLTVGLFNQYADALAEQFSGLRYLIVGGDALDPQVIGRVIYGNRPQHLLNGYGPTETTTFAITHEVNAVAEKARSIPIGRPIANTRAYILGEQGEPTPIGVTGELYIGGEGLARGYLNRTELTAERFVPDPFTTEAGARIYKTGDLARWQADGNIDFVGRNDNQVKIRGFRIELGEIEARLAEHPAVHEAVVLAREDEPGDKRLVAYVVADQEAEEDDSGNKKAGLWISELRAHLSAVLPDYMVPAAYVRMERLPLTLNGKIDRKSLPEPDKDIREQEYVGPRNATEETLCRLWQEVLRRERVGIHDNFFNIGGHSLLAVQVISRIKQAFTVEMPLSALFAAPTVARMAEHIAAVNEPDRSQSSPVLVNIQPHGSWPPFFCVHAVGGQVISYAELSQELGLEQPFYGLQSPPANYFPEPGVSIEQLATLYNREIRSVQPRGPYLLSGWSMGGLVAWEMAQQLRKEGEIISLLALIDTAPPPRYREAEDRADEISMLARFAMDMSRLVGRDPGPLVERFLQAAEQDQWKMVQETLTSSGVLAPKTAHAEMTALLEVYTRNFRAMNNYSIQTSEQAVIYFRASETPERFSRVWTKWSDGGIQFHSVPGDHFTMLRRPGVRVIAETLQRYISTNSNNALRL
jgi:amino acid adenylation domain-containing protein